MDKLTQLIARAEIQDCMARYARGVDRSDWESVRATYHDDAVDEHGEFKGSADEFVAWVSERLAGFPFVTHFLGNSLIEFTDEQTAVVETYYIARHRLPASDSSGEIDVEVTGRYVDLFENRDAVWRVAHRRVVRDAMCRQPAISNSNFAGLAGSRDASDPLYIQRKQAGLSAR